MGNESPKIRQGSAPNFCPPTEEGVTISLEDENGDSLEFEFLGLILKDGKSYGFFFPIDDENPILSSGEVVLLEVVGTDEEGQPSEFELIDDESIAAEIYEEFKTATSDLYVFE